MSAEYIIAIAAVICALGTFIFGIWQLRGKAGNGKVESLERRVERLEKELKIKTEERDTCYKEKGVLKAENYELMRKLSEVNAL